MKISTLAVLLGFSLIGSARAATLAFDFGAADQLAPGNYNHVAATQLPIFNAIDSTGAPTGIGMTTAGFNQVGPNFNGTTSPTGAAAIFHAEATRDSLFGHSDDFNAGAPRPTGTIVLSGLDSSGATLYDFTFFASRTGVGDNRETQYSLAGLNTGVGYLNASNNVSNVATVTGMAPSAAGEITLTVTAGPNNNNGSRFFYLGAMTIESRAIPEPAAFGMILVIGVAALSARRKS